MKNIHKTSVLLVCICKDDMLDNQSKNETKAIKSTHDNIYASIMKCTMLQWRYEINEVQ